LPRDETMNRRTPRAPLFAPLLLLAFATVASPAPSGEEQAIVRLIEQAARAMSELPKTKDAGSVLDLYAPDYQGLNDGEPQSREGLSAVVAEIEENVKLGNPVSITNRATNIRARAEGSFGWATYDFHSRIEVLGEVLGEVERRCTGIYVRRNEAWRIRHEHCSTVWAAPAAEPEPEDGDSDGAGLES
jgi:ketosteroid isomerase-like protein